MARRDEDDGEELLRPAGGGCRRVALILSVCLVGSVLLIWALGRTRTNPAPVPQTRPTEKVLPPAPGDSSPELAETKANPAPTPTSAARPTPPFEPTPPTAARPSPRPTSPFEPAAPSVTRLTPRATPSAEPAAPKPVVIKSGGVTLTVHSLKKKDSLGEWVPAKGFFVYTADVELSSSGAGLKYGPRSFRLRDKAERESEASLRRFDGALLSGMLKRGGRVRGVVAFSARESQGLSLSFSPGGVGGPLVARLTD